MNGTLQDRKRQKKDRCFRDSIVTRPHSATKEFTFILYTSQQENKRHHQSCPARIITVVILKQINWEEKSDY